MQALPILLFLLLAQSAPLPGQQDADEGETQQAVRLAIAKRYDEALAILHRQLSVRPDDTQVNYLIGLCYFYKEDLQRSVRFLEASVNNRPQFPNPYLWLVRAYLLQQKPEKARQVLSEGLKRFPRHQPLRELRDRVPEGVRSRESGRKGEEEDEGAEQRFAVRRSQFK